MTCSTTHKNSQHLLGRLETVSIIVVALLCVSSLSDTANADDGVRRFDAYCKLLACEQAVVDAELELATHDFHVFQGLHRRGHASWLEVRKREFTVDQLEARKETLGEFQQTLLEFSDKSLRVTDQPQGFVPFTDLQVSWPRTTPTLPQFDRETNQVDDDLERSRAEVAELESIVNALHESDSWKKRYALRLALAKSNLSLYEMVAEAAADPNEKEEGQAPALGAKEAKVEIDDAKVKATMTDHLRVRGEWIQSQLADARNRLRDAEQLHTKQIATSEEVEAAETVVSYFVGLSFVHQIVTNGVDKIRLARRDQQTTAKVQHQFAKLEARLQKRSADLRREMTAEILNRLEKASRQSSPADSVNRSEFARSLDQRRQAEMSQYQQRIRALELEAELATARLLVLEQCDSPLSVDVASLDTNAFANVTVPVSVNPTGFEPPRFENLIDWRATAFPQFRFQADSGFDINSAEYELRRIGRPTTATRSVRSWVNSRRTLVLDVAPLSLNSTKPFPRRHRAYEFGILRSEFRRSITAGQPPWYLPGSPTNIRDQQLRSRNPLFKTSR